MLIWLVKEGENTPIEKNSRKMRTWIKAEEFIKYGDSVVWWHSTFSHQQKKLLSVNDKKISISDKFQLNLVHAGTYKKNLSIKRYFHGLLLAYRYKKLFSQEQKPDLIICAFPPIHTTYQVLKYAKKNNIPFILDVQDIWPDAIILKLPLCFRSVAKFFFLWDKYLLKKIMNLSTSIVAVSQGFLRRCQKYGNRSGNLFDKTFYLGYRTKQSNILISDSKISELNNERKNKTVFTFIGSFGLSYQIDLLCRVAKRINEEKSFEAHFVFAGAGESFETLYNTYHPQRNITFLGWINESQIQQLLSITDIGLVPCKSDIDTVPNKPFEYLSHGIPLLSSLEGEMENIINDYKIGFSYKWDDEIGLYNLIKTLVLEADLRADFKKNAQQVFDNEFSNETIYKNYIQHAYSVYTDAALVKK